jgi:hypothetical protein
VSRGALLLSLGLAVVNTVLVNWSQPLFGRWWQYVMWEGGVVEDLTALQFLAGGVVFAMCALQRERPVVHRVWFGIYAVAEFVLAGEETNYGTGTLFLDLTNPTFAQSYNPQAQNLHNYLIEAYIPVLTLGIICAILRARFDHIVGALRLPMTKDFLDAVLLTALGLPLMAAAFRDERFLSVDEVYEWSSSLLLLCLALFWRFGWIFRRRPEDLADPRSLRHATHRHE